jgi:hypothetical protein
MSLKISAIIIGLLACLYSADSHGQIPILDKKVNFYDVFSDSLPEVVIFLPISNIAEEDYVEMIKILNSKISKFDSTQIKPYLFQDNSKSKSKGLNILIDSANTTYINEIQVFFNNFEKQNIERATNKYSKNYYINKNESFLDFNLYNVDIVDTTICFMGIEYKIPEYADLINELMNPVYSQQEINEILNTEISQLKKEVFITEKTLKNLEIRVKILEEEKNVLQETLKTDYRKKNFKHHNSKKNNSFKKK